MQVKKLILSTIAFLILLPALAFGQASYVEAPAARVHSTTGPLYILADGAKQISILNNVGTTATGFYLDGTTGALTSVGGASISAPITLGSPSNFGTLLGTDTQSLIGITTVDAADNKSLYLESGSTASVDGSRGGTIVLDGNEVATTGGTCRVLAGNVSTANADIDIEHASSSIRFRDLTTGTLWSITDAGVLTQDATNGSDLQLNKTASNITIGTTDGTDNKTLGLAAGSTVVTDGSRGGTIILDGNEVATSGGAVRVRAGDVSTANIDLSVENASSNVRVRDITTGTLWTFSDAGNLTADSTNGGSLVMAKEDTGVLFGTTALDADVTAVSGSTPHFGLVDNSGNQDQFAIVQDGANALGVQMRFYKTRSAAPASDANTIVSASDVLGTIGMFGADGVDYKQATAIRSIVDGAPSAGVMPGALIFSTKNTSSTLDRLKIDSSGNLVVDATNGGDLVMAKASTGLVAGEASRQATVVTAGGTSPLYEAVSSAATHVAEWVGFNAVSQGPTADFFKTRAVTGAPTTIVASGDVLGRIQFWGANGTGYDVGAQIIVTSDSTASPGASADMPGAIDFTVSPDGSATPASALKITNDKKATFTGTVVAPGLNFPTANEEAVAGAGTTVTDAAALSSTKHVHQLTGANGTVGWKFAAATAGQTEFLLNTTAGVPKVYAVSGGTCNGGSADVACSLTTGILLHMCYATASNTWICA